MTDSRVLSAVPHGPWPLPVWWRPGPLAAALVDAGWDVTLAAVGPGVVAVALTRGRQLCDLVVTADTGALTVSLTPDTHTDAPGPALQMPTSVTSAGLAHAAVTLLRRADRWWPTGAPAAQVRAETLRLLVAGPALEMGLDVNTVGDDQAPWDVLPAPLPELVVWALDHGGQVLPCPHRQAARQVFAGGFGPPDATALSAAGRVAGMAWMATLLTYRWTPDLVRD